ncbi:MAG: SDR family NAD(P)-dependent oxidoreductase [Planctomycetota bacterium]
MAEKRKILLQLDTDSRASSFDSVVAVDSDVDVLLCHADVTPENVVDIVYGAIFTRPAKHLSSTAIFVGGSNVSAGEEVMDKIVNTFFGNHRVSVMLDSSGANTTAAAAVVAAMRHGSGGDEPLTGKSAVVLGATGPVGRRVVRLLASAGASVVVGSRSQDRADEVAGEISAAVEGAQSITGAATGDSSELAAAMEGAELVFATGGPGVCLLSEDARKACGSLEVAVDLNAVPPAGIEGVGPTVAGEEIDGVICYGAIGVGGIKMKIHRSCVASLFESNDLVLDADEMLAVGRTGSAEATTGKAEA